MSKKTLRLILGDQLCHDLATLKDIAPEDTVLMCEVRAEATYVKHHKKKIAYIFAAMRAFASELEAKGHSVRYVRYDDEHNAGDFDGEVRRALDDTGAQRLVVTEPGEYRLMQVFRGWKRDLQVDVEIRNDDRFIATRKDFADWAEGRKQLRMEYFYRDMRRKTGLLMDGDDPEGGQWNYDHDNREAIPDDVSIPERPEFSISDTTEQVLELVADNFAEHFGDLKPFNAPVTRAQALYALDWFIKNALPDFGRYQDAMRQGAPFMFHSLLSAPLNCGLLTAFEICQRAEEAYKKGDAPLNAVEGFIRQIIGWREYVRGLYWLKMPEYKDLNYFDADRPLPAFYYDGNTKMNCLRQAIVETRQNAYAHHIQRLMITGNFALLAGIDPEAINAWYLEVYWDAYEWVELPNTHGMAIYADGGIMASKPYAAGGNYINKMSNYCGKCSYQVSKKNGDKACPFNYLYWDFMARNREKLQGNPRISRIYSTYDRMADDKKKAIAEDAERFFNGLD